MNKAQRIMKDLQDAREQAELLIKDTYIDIPTMSPNTGTFKTFKIREGGGLKIPYDDDDGYLSSEHALKLGRWLIEMFEDDEEHKAEVPRDKFPDLLEDIFASELKDVSNESYVKTVKVVAHDLKESIDEQVESALTITDHRFPSEGESE